MAFFPSLLCKHGILRFPMFAAVGLTAAGLLSTYAAGGAMAQAAPSSSPESPSPEPHASVRTDDTSIFLQPIPNDQLSFLNHFAGMPAKDVVRDKQYLKFMRRVLPVCIFHYGWDMSPFDAFQRVLTGSPLPVQIRDGRYFAVSGRSGPYLQGRGLMWVDMQEGVALAAFYFHPTNGEPTPTVTVFSRQVKEESLRLSQLPLGFVEALSLWSVESGVPAVTTRYFIGDSQKKILLEHDEDYCAPINPANASPAGNCEEMDADAADIDLNAAYYLEQTNYATNATAWMIVGPDQVAWIELRDNTCRIRHELLRCRISMTRERTHIVLSRPPAVRPTTPHPPRK